MNRILILHNHHDKASRDFINALPENYSVVNYYSEEETEDKKNYFSMDLPRPMKFPAVIDTVDKAIVYPETASIEDALAELEAVALEKKIAPLKALRNKLLADCDYVMLSDSQASEACKAEFIAYRQALRDMDFSDPSDIAWPIAPTYIKA